VLCNLTTIQDAMRRLFRIDRDVFGNLRPSRNVNPDRPAPVAPPLPVAEVAWVPS